MKAKLAHEKYKELSKDVEGSEPIEFKHWNDFFLSAESVTMQEVIAMKNTHKLIMKVMIEVIQELLIKTAKDEG